MHLLGRKGPSVRHAALVCLLALLLSPPWRAAATGADEPLVRFAVIGDSGTGDEHQRRIAQQMAAWRERLP
jgi:hypothetical protein